MAVFVQNIENTKSSPLEIDRFESGNRVEIDLINTHRSRKCFHVCCAKSRFILKHHRSLKTHTILHNFDKYRQNPPYFVGDPKTREKGLKIVSFPTFVRCTALGSCSMIQPMLEIDSSPSNYPRNTLL